MSRSPSPPPAPSPSSSLPPALPESRAPAQNAMRYKDQGREMMERAFYKAIQQHDSLPRGQREIFTRSFAQGSERLGNKQSSLLAGRKAMPAELPAPLLVNENLQFKANRKRAMTAAKAEAEKKKGSNSGGKTGGARFATRRIGTPNLILDRENLPLGSACLEPFQDRSSPDLFGELPIVILMGDFHQFSPVRGSVLWKEPRTGNDDDANGRMIWHQFTDVIIMDQQMRQAEDPAFQDLLGRARAATLTGTNSILGFGT